MKNRHGNGRSFYGGFFVMEGDNTVGSWEQAAGKSRGGTPFCRTLKIGFPKRSSPRNTT